MQEEIENMRSLNGKTLGNWQDWNIGSIMEPVYYSDACECGSQ